MSNKQNKLKKRGLAMLLSLTIAIWMCNITAFAADDELLTESANGISIVQNGNVQTDDNNTNDSTEGESTEGEGTEGESAEGESAEGESTEGEGTEGESTDDTQAIVEETAVQKFLNAVAALPTVTLENAQEVSVLLDNCMDLYGDLSEEDMDREDVAGALAAIEALMGEIQTLEEQDNGIVEVKSYSDLASAIKAAGTDPVTITVAESFDFTSYLEIPAGANITLTANEGVVLGRPNTNPVLWVKGTLTLENIVFDGKNISAKYALLHILATGDVTMGEGTVIQNAYNDYTGKQFGGGVYNAGTFTMNGGTISGNTAKSYGGGVYNTGTFTMNGGVISNNTNPTWYGGGVYNTGTFTMTGGEISGNQATNNSYGHGGGVYNTGTFTMNAGTISENTAKKNGGGVYNTGTFTATGGAISGNTGGYNGGGGVYSKNVGVNMLGTTISGNVNGGVVVDASYKNAGESYTLSNLTITGNTGSKSALSVESAAAWKIQNCSITDNEITGTGDKASVIYVAISSASSEETANVLNGCTISGNTTQGYAALYLSCGSGRTLQVTDCTITGNTGNTCGGVYCGSVSGQVTFGEGTRIENNTGKTTGGVHLQLSSNGTGCVTVDGAVVTGNTGGTTGGVYTSGKRFNFTSGAIYGNNGSDFQTGGADQTYTLIAASQMSDSQSGIDFSGLQYSWAGAPNGTEDQPQSHEGGNGVVMLTAQPNLVRYFAKIGDTNYETLQEALEAADANGTIEVIYGADGFGSKYEINNPFTISKSVTLKFDGQEIIAKDGGELFTIGEGVTLTLQGNAMMGGKIIVSEGKSLTMDGGIIPYYYSNGSPIVKDLIIDVQGGSFTINGTVAYSYAGLYPKVNLAAGQRITAGEGFAIENTDLGNGNYKRGGIKIALDDETYNLFNNSASDAEIENVVLVEGCDSDYVLSRIILTKAFANDLVKVNVVDGDIVLSKATITGAVFVDGQSGDNSHDGTTSKTPVKDLEAAKALLGDNTTIYVMGQLTLSGELDGELPNGDRLILKRYPGYKGDLVKASDLTVTNIILDGSADDLGAKDNGALLVVSSGVVTLGENAELRNNASKGVLKAPVVVGDNAVFNMTGGKITGNKSTTDTTLGLYSEAAGAVIIYGWSDGSVGGKMILSGGEISGNTNAAIGGAITLAGNAELYMDGGKITGNKSTGGRGTGHGGGVCVAGRTGGMSANYDAQCIFTMNGGEISGNEACYGGGIYVNSNYVTLNAGKITGNTARETGGGVYVETPKEGTSTAAQLKNALITGNTATEMGGGLYFCPTGTGKLYVNDGAAIYDNSAIGNPAAADDLISVVSDGPKSATLSERMLGGGKVAWYRDGVALGVGIWGAAQNAPRYDAGNPGQPVPAGTYEDNLALKAVVSEAAKALATANAQLFITGNKAVRGGGVGSNGSVTMGSDPNEPNNPKEYTLTIKKDWKDIPESDWEPVEIQIWVNVDNVPYELDTVKLNQENEWTATLTGLPESIKNQIWITELTQGYKFTSSTELDERNAEITITGTNFPLTQLTVNKVWANDNEDVRPDSVTVQLYRDGEPYETVNLTVGNWSYTWDELNPDYKWTVGEINVPEGYVSTQTTNGEVVTITNTYTPEKPEEPTTPYYPETPKEDVPEEEIPLTPPEEEVPEDETPLAPPEEEEEEFPEDDIPLVDAPKTGSNASWAWAVISAAGLALLALAGKKRKSFTK